MDIESNIGVDYTRLGRAINFYQKLGYTLVSAPWTTPLEYVACTAPAHALQFPFQTGYLVASAEQSFIYLMDTKQLAPGKYMAVTPCFRNELIYSALTRPYFIKLELFDSDPTAWPKLLTDAQAFFEAEQIPTTVLPTSETSQDLMSQDIELGSYGQRTLILKNQLSWSYGTGLAEPRASIAYARYSKQFPCL